MSRWSLGAGLALACFTFWANAALAQPAAEDPSVLAERLRKVERELRDLQWQMSKVGGVPSADAEGEFGVAAPAPTPQKYDDMEQSLRRLTGDVEQLSFDVRKLQDQYAAFQRDTQFRLSALEGGAPASFTGLTPPPAPQASVSGGPAAMTLGPQTGQPRTTAPGAGTLGTIPAGSAPALAGAPAVGTADDQYNAALNLLSKQQYPEAQAAFRSFAAANPKHKLAGTAQFFAADIDFVQKNYPAAAQGFTAVLRGYPTSPRAPDAMLKLGLSLLQAGDKKNGCLTLTAIKQKYPNANGEILNRAGRARLQGGC